MKFKTIATIIVILFLIALTVLFSPRTQVLNEDGTPVETIQQN